MKTNIQITYEEDGEQHVFQVAGESILLIVAPELPQNGSPEDMLRNVLEKAPFAFIRTGSDMELAATLAFLMVACSSASDGVPVVDIAYNAYPILLFNQL